MPFKIGKSKGYPNHLLIKLSTSDYNESRNALINDSLCVAQSRIISALKTLSESKDISIDMSKYSLETVNSFDAIVHAQKDYKEYKESLEEIENRNV